MIAANYIGTHKPEERIHCLSPGMLMKAKSNVFYPDEIYLLLAVYEETCTWFGATVDITTNLILYKGTLFQLSANDIKYLVEI